MQTVPYNSTICPFIGSPNPLEDQSGNIITTATCSVTMTDSANSSYGSANLTGGTGGFYQGCFTPSPVLTVGNQYLLNFTATYSGSTKYWVETVVCVLDDGSSSC